MIVSATEVDDFKGKTISLKLALLLCVLTAIGTWTVGEVYFHFKLMSKNIEATQELHDLDMKYIKEKIEYERKRNDRKFEDLEQN